MRWRVNRNDIMSRVVYLVILCDLENKESLASGSRKTERARRWMVYGKIKRSVMLVCGSNHQRNDQITDHGGFWSESPVGSRISPRKQSRRNCGAVTETTPLY